MTSRSVAVSALVLAVACSSGTKGPQGDPGPQGQRGVEGPPGSSPVVSAGSPLALDPAGHLTIATASATDAGVLSAEDWSSFNSRVSGGDPRLSDPRVPLGGSALYIQAGPAAPQAASIDLSGSARVGSLTTAGGNVSITDTGGVTVTGAGGFSGDGALLTNLTAGQITGTLAVGQGGTGRQSLGSNAVLLGNGAGALQSVAPGASGSVLTSNGTTWVSQPAAAVPVPPLVTQVSPAGGSQGGGTSITITGANFTGPVSVSIGGVAATGVTVTGSTTITATTGASASGGAMDVLVTNAAGQMGALPRGYWYGGRRYYRITLLNGTSGATTIQLAELNLYDDLTGRWVEPAMTSASTPAPYAVTGTATAFTSSAAWKVFDGVYPTASFNDGYMSNTASSSVEIDLGSLCKITRYRIWTSTYSDGGGSYRPTKWRLEASSDSSSWTTIDSRDIGPSGVPAGGFIEFQSTPL